MTAPRSAITAPRYCICVPQVHLRILHSGTLCPASAPQKICQTALAGHSIQLVQISVSWVQISLFFFKCICTTEHHVHPVTRRVNVILPRATFLNMLTTLKKYLKNISYIYRTLFSIYIQQNHLQPSPISWDYPFKLWICIHKHQRD
jgi:hypothetical protein